MPRTIAHIALVQILLVVLGFFALGIVLKIEGWPSNDTVRWNPLAVFLRNNGLYLLFVPVLWTALALAAHHFHGSPLTGHIAAAVGICLAVTIISLFIYSAVCPYTQPMFIYRGPLTATT